MQSIPEDRELPAGGEISEHQGFDSKSWDTWDPMGEHFYSESNTLSLDPEKDPMCQVADGRLRAGSRGKIGNIKLCEHYLKYGECADGQYCDRAHVSPKSRDKIESLEQEYEQNVGRIIMGESFLSPVDIKEGTNVLHLITITRVKSPVDFSFVMPYGNLDCSKFAEEDLQFYIEHEDRSPAKKKLREFHNQMSYLYDQKFRPDDMRSDLYLNQIVACRLPNGIFRRAEVIKRADWSQDEFLYKLRLIDIGTEVEIHRHQIYDMMAKFLSEPPLCVQARLDLTPIDGGYWSSKAINSFITETRGEDFMLCKVLKFQPIDQLFVVDLMNLRTRKSIGVRLIEMNLAAPYN